MWMTILSIQSQGQPMTRMQGKFITGTTHRPSNIYDLWLENNR